MASITRRRRSRYDLLPAWLTGKRIVLALTAAVVIVLGTYGVRVAVGLAHLFHTDPFSAIAGAIHGGGGSSIDQAVQNGQRVNIMLYGYGGGSHDGAFLSDSIMLVSIQPQPNGPPQVAEISIPRDWYVPIDLGNGNKTAGRINEAYSDGMNGNGPVDRSQTNAGAAVADPTMAHLLGVDINHFVGIDFQAFSAAVDAVGGVDVNVTNTFTDTQYPHGECSQGDCAYETVHFNAGMQHMNGANALIFARSRHGNNGEGSDFARSRRQQLIIAALKSKVVSLGGIGNLPDVIGALGENVLTDLKIGDAEALYNVVKNVDPKSIEHVSIDDTNFLYDCGYPGRCGAFYLYANDSSFQSVHHFIGNVFPAQGALSEEASVTYFDASGRRAGASTRWASLTGMLGFTTKDGGTTAKQVATEVIDQSGGKNTQTAKWLASYFGVSVTTQQVAAGAAGGTPASTGGVVVVLGSDEEKAFLGNPGVGR